ncbi:MAG TPA: hypothetical protein VMR86_00730 [Myxococcota bacterium]|nr:hypothetical protein [Myxococcota bacterium]
MTVPLAFAGNSHAGAFGTPFKMDVCPAGPPTDDMVPPGTTWFRNAGTKPCIKLCDSAAAQCRALAKRDLSCDLSWAGTELKFSKAGCAVTASNSAELKACNSAAAAEHEALVGDFKANLSAALTGCDSWKATCEASCTP